MSKSPFSIICVGKEPGHFYTTVFPIFEFNTSFTGELLFYSETEILQDSIDGFCILFHDIQNIDELFLHKLRNKHNFLFSPVIAISRNASIQESVLAIKAGYQDYLDWKAITSSEIFRLVHHYSPEKQAYKKNHEFYIKTRELVGELVSDYTFGIVYNHKTESFLFEWEFGKKIIGSVIFQETIRTFGKKIFLKNLKLKESDILSLLKTEHGSKIETVIDFVENGEKHWLSILLIHFKEKEEQFFIGIARDVTEKILSEEKLHRQSELIAAIFDNSPLYMSMYDGKGYLLRVNKAKSKFLKKYNIAKKPGKYNLFSDPVIKDMGLYIFFKKVYDGETVDKKEFYLYSEKFLCEEGIYLDGILLPLKDQQGKIEFVVTFLREVNEQVEIRKTLQIRERYLNTIVDMQAYLNTLGWEVPDWLNLLGMLEYSTLADKVSLFLGTETDVFWKCSTLQENETAYTTFTNYASFLKELADRSIRISKYIIVSKLRTGYFSILCPIPLSQGQWAFFLIELGILIPFEKWWNKEAELLHLALQAIISYYERRKIQDSIIESEARYRELAEENKQLLILSKKDAETKGILLEEVNHRVKNNLASILGILELEKMKNIQSQKEYFGIIHQLSTRIQSLADVHGILSSSNWTEVPLEEIVYQISENVVYSYSKVKIKLQLLCEDTIFVNAKQATTIALLTNELIVNSIKHAFKDIEHPKIIIHILRNHNVVQLVFLDNGIGFPESVINEEEGNIGLKIVKMSARATLKGGIILKNELGAKVTISFVRKL